MIRALLDANALASGIVGGRVVESTPGEILRRWRTGQFALFVSEHLLSEVRRTLLKPYFADRLPSTKIQDGLLRIENEALRIVVTVTVSGIATHPEDDLVLAAAASANVDVLVTGDRQLLKLGQYDGVRIVSPREFLAILDAETPDDAQPTRVASPT